MAPFTHSAGSTVRPRTSERRRRGLVHAAAFALALGTFHVACGGSSGSGVDPNKDLTDLTSSEKKKLCESFSRLLEERLPLELRCRPDGLTAAVSAALMFEDAEAACSEAAGKCQEEVSEPFPCDDEALENFPSCDAKVGDLEGCGSDYVGVLVDRVNQFPTCAGFEEFAKSASGEETEELSAPIELPSRCESLPSDCNFPPEL